MSRLLGTRISWTTESNRTTRPSRRGLPVALLMLLLLLSLLLLLLPLLHTLPPVRPGSSSRVDEGRAPLCRCGRGGEPEPNKGAVCVLVPAAAGPLATGPWMSNRIPPPLWWRLLCGYLPPQFSEVVDIWETVDGIKRVGRRHRPYESQERCTKMYPILASSLYWIEGGESLDG